ncbi:conserved hypothetical protein [Verticillium alfalfae VaMs.102]|uniref:Uncharacterized protein n=1 Tax=Verticillium alfalfae (strain VaMs.102 / ATCC MYA-4576 / FGSC 10136) TaxID=526221 RepID=C9SW62_VERA1|nr:conserved hypothetical protein [Verticillium alfalfae VaMs.102]EEY23027.1 conserved hypothetical protein [Verticillium alfalfae VaMs.102]
MLGNRTSSSSMWRLSSGEIKRARARVEKETFAIRNATEDILTPANAFETHAGLPLGSCRASKLPEHLWRNIELATLRSPLSSLYQKLPPDDLTTAGEVHLEHAKKLGSQLHRAISSFGFNLFDPDEALSSVVETHSLGSWEEMALTLQNSYAAWSGSEGVLDLWTGDTGELCGEDWYFSGLHGAGFTGVDSYEPKCIWISSSHVKQSPNSGFQIHWPSYKPQKSPGATGDGKESYLMPPFRETFHRTCDPDSAVFRTHKYPDIYTANIVGYRQTPRNRKHPSMHLTLPEPSTKRRLPSLRRKPVVTRMRNIRYQNHQRAKSVARGNKYKYQRLSVIGCPQSRRVKSLFRRPWGKEEYLDVGKGRPRHSKRQQDGGNEAAVLNGTSTASDPASASQNLLGPENPFNWLVVDSFAGNSAAYLRSSNSSRGPDFANAKETMFCLMSDKTLHPFCADNDKKTADGRPCFDLESQQLVRGGIVR